MVLAAQWLLGKSEAAKADCGTASRPNKARAVKKRRKKLCFFIIKSSFQTMKIYFYVRFDTSQQPIHDTKLIIPQERGFVNSLGRNFSKINPPGEAPRGFAVLWLTIAKDIKN